MTASTTGTLGDDQALKARHRAMWALGNYPAVAADVIPDLGAVLVEASGITAGAKVLDVATGSGNAAIPAALAGADVTGCDLTPELLQAAQDQAAARNASVTWREADAEALPFPDAAFDAVISCVGVMFAPHHEAAAAELLRVCRPGGTIGLISWTPEGFVGEMLATMKPYLSPPPPGTRLPPLWGCEDHVRTLLGGGVTDLTAKRRSVRVDTFPTPEAFRDYFRANYGPTTAAYRALATDPARTTALDQALAALARRHDQSSDPNRTVMDWEYLLVTARRAP